MEGRMTPTLLSLPSEIQKMIEAYLNQHDFTVCVRVCKAWHDWFIDGIWHTVECFGPDVYQLVFDHSGRRRSVMTGQIMYHRLTSLRNFKEAISNASKNNSTRAIDRSDGDGSKDHTSASNDAAQMSEEKAKVLFTRQIHRIRVLKLTYISLQDLFYEKPQVTKNGDDNEERDDGYVLSAGLPDLHLEKLSIDFMNDCPPLRPPGASRLPTATTPVTAPPPMEYIDVQPVLQILERSKNLRWLTINLEPLSSRGQVEDQARLLAALPASLERLTLGDSLYSKIPVPYTEYIVTDRPRFGALRALCINGPLTDTEFSLVTALLDNCLVLDELITVTRMEDSKLAKILSKGSKGWRTLCVYPGPLSAAVILEHCPTLENLRIPDCTHFPSTVIQKLLCSAPCLKRLDLIPEDGLSYRTVVLNAGDIIESSEDWVCLKLESFKCMIGGIPRPDLRARTNGRPLEGVLHDPRWYTPQQSRAMQKRVLAQLGRLTILREITLGLDNLNVESGNHEVFWEEEKAEGDYYKNYEIQQDRQYACLSLSLEDGLDLLKDLKQVRRLRIDKMSVRMGVQEQAWVKENWPNYRKESKDSFWTSRGFGMKMLGDENCPEMFEVDRWNLHGFDWW